MPDIHFYERSLDGGKVMHVVRAVDGIITNQWLNARQGYAIDTSHGNPEWIGQPVKVIRGKGFKRVRGAHRAELLSLTTEE